ncbi:hypothetical protein NHX12_005087 [Muraenolepis orangiensis]|uniref:Vitamin K-dependent protein C n=1 Tax=Muraenolepis orangiensis TaxID=630683 RepID=A0A9Q0DWK8_9TELE|nr:hypothetical protein NHX12_005087 [Muraenolepis orangiensis]
MVFSSGPDAHAVLRSKRANSFLEELKPASLERECREERCDFEEAREIFITKEAMMEFWTSYTDGNQCKSHLCVHGSCVDMFQAYKCHCEPAYEGKFCDQPRVSTNCSVDNGECDHQCTDSEDGLTRTCSCVDGYRLHDNAKSCVPIDRSSCGRLLITRSSYSAPITGLQPWSWVLTAAHCISNHLRFSVRLGDYERFNVEGTEETLAVSQVFKHPGYSAQTVDNDIALLRLATPAPLSNYIVPACLPPPRMAERVLHVNGTVSVVTGWGKDSPEAGRFSSALNVIKVPLVEHAACQLHMDFNVSENMLCAGVLGSAVDACEGDSGGPMVTLYRDTWFLLGLVSWGEGCGQLNKLGVYTKVSNYHGWIDGVRQDWDRTHGPRL